MSSVAWYWHRLRAMTPAELASHGRRKLHQFSDRFAGSRRFAPVTALPAGGHFPQLPPPALAPESLRAALRRDREDILAGRWIAFGHLPLQVEVPPRWHMDYLAGIDLATRKPALKLHHRLEGAADIKLIWEPSRWYSLVRLAQAAYVLQDTHAAGICLRWLEHWADENPPYYGWNWVSALETGLRLIQFVWIDALLTAVCPADASAENKGSDAAPHRGAATLARLRARLLPPHLWFTWRDRSFGSSANNHLIGELSGLLLALVRWKELTRWAAPLDALQRLWEREVLTQFAPDGGNREQALNYHLFSWEFCWQTRLALRAASRPIAPEVEERLRAAAAFFCAVQVPEQPWDYGDSDSAFVTPLFAQWKNATGEWHRWLSDASSSPSIAYWIGEGPNPLSAPAVVVTARHWRVYPESGLAVCRLGDWFLRWDLSPLGYLATAGHGHCDALHLSIWHRGEALLIDPGTGAYHSNRPLRDYLASWNAHNGPHPVQADFPERRGAFLWSAQHALPQWRLESDLRVSGELHLPGGIMRRTITRLEAEDGWCIEDEFQSAEGRPPQATEIFWQFAPAARLEAIGKTAFRIELNQSQIACEIDPLWDKVEHGSPTLEGGSPPDKGLRGLCSPAFRSTSAGPYLLLHGPASGPQNQDHRIARNPLHTKFRLENRS